MLCGFDGHRFPNTVSTTWLKCDEFDDHHYPECYKQIILLRGMSFSLQYR